MTLWQRYIGFEGIDGSGKDTQLAILARRLTVAGITPILLQEPSHGPYGREIRANLAAFTRDVEEQRRLFIEDRRDHVATKIKPALRFVRENPAFVILQSRCIVSAAAYQPRGEGDAGLMATIEAELHLAPMPDAVVILDVLVEAALDRIRAEGAPDSLERLDLLTAASQRYRRLAQLVPQCLIVDAEADELTVAERVLNALEGQPPSVPT